MLLLTENVIMLPAVLFTGAPPADVILPALDAIGGECRLPPHQCEHWRVLQINKILEHTKI